ncbi:MAG: TerB family tellurite resistance protein [Bacteroidetes bacterium]|nr:TerB family tellurite resistance protein [Bacteroidota bacterium]
MNKNYQLGLLHLVHLLISADGVIEEREKKGLERIKVIEKISDELFNEFVEMARKKKERDIYNDGITMLNACTEEEKIMAFVHLYKISEADNDVHVKEVRLLLYSVKMSNVEFNDVVARAAGVHY